MRAEIETEFGKASRWNIRPAPSLRVPVTAANRELLRRLRAAELSAWESGRPGAFVRFDEIMAGSRMPPLARAI